jgi:endo-1,4-beta-xylanase
MRIILCALLLATFASSASLCGEISAHATLRTAAEKRQLVIGAAVNFEALSADNVYREVLAREFNAVTPENELKWDLLSRERGKYDYRCADVIVKFAEDNKMKVHGHVFVWHTQNPEWLNKGEFNRGEMLEILKEHITAVTAHYKGRVAMWDVVNEAMEDWPKLNLVDKGLRKTIWRTRIGDDYIEQAFRIAHEAAPDVKLLYNDYGIENICAKSDRLYELITELIKKKTPIHGIGFQMHVTTASNSAPFDAGAHINPESFSKNLRRFADLGLEIYVTEMDVRLKLPTGKYDLESQAQVYKEVIGCCLKEPACKGFSTWGVTDKYSWVPAFFTGWGSALLFDEYYKPKPAHRTSIETLGDNR